MTTTSSQHSARGRRGVKAPLTVVAALALTLGMAGFAHPGSDAEGEADAETESDTETEVEVEQDDSGDDVSPEWAAEREERSNMAERHIDELDEQRNETERDLEEEEKGVLENLADLVDADV